MVNFDSLPAIYFNQRCGFCLIFVGPDADPTFQFDMNPDPTV
jgi:hypothetical protein